MAPLHHILSPYVMAIQSRGSRPQHKSESPRGLVKPGPLSPTPSFLVQEVWGGA